MLFTVLDDKLKNCQKWRPLSPYIGQEENILKEFQIPSLQPKMNSTFLTFPLYISELSAKIWPRYVQHRQSSHTSVLLILH